MKEASGSCRLGLGLVLLITSCLCATSAFILGPRFRNLVSDPRPAPWDTIPPYTPWPTPPIAQAFDYPLQPPEAYGPYVHGLTGPHVIDTRFGAQNPAFGNRPNCFRDSDGSAVPFSKLYHAGVDLFSLDRADQVLWDGAAGDPVHAVGEGVAVKTLDAGAEGQILITQHLLADGSTIYAVYWHVDHIRVVPGQPVERGQIIALVYDQGFNSHLHWEMRTFLDGSHLFPEGTAGARGSCNGHVAGVAYTWDDVPERARPEFYGYLDPMAFVASHQ